MANCRACTAPLPDGATACPACDEPVAAPKKTKTKRAAKPSKDAESPDEAPASDAAPEGSKGSESLRAEGTPSNDAMLAFSTGVASCALGFLPCLLPWFLLYMPAAGLTIGSAAVAVWKGTVELDAIKAGDSPEAGEKLANMGRIAGFAGAVVGVLMLVVRIALNTIPWSSYHHR